MTGTRRKEPITVGVPFPRAACVEPRQVVLSDAQRNHIPYQAEVLDTWPDGSIRWLLLDFNANSPDDVRLAALTDAVPAGVPQGAVSVAQDGATFVVRNGALAIEVRPADGCLMAIQNTQGDALERRVWIAVTDEDGSDARLRLESARVETSGPCRTTILVTGTVGLKDCPLLLEARVHVFAASTAVRLDVCVRNTRRAQHQGGFWELGDQGSASFRDISIRVQLPGSVSRTLCYPEGSAPPVTSTSPIVLYQDSSGGTHWQSRVHVNREGRVPYRFRGYQIDNGTVHAAGLRAVPAMVVEHGGTTTAACLQHFWQNFPKSLEADEQGLTVRLFPRQFDDVYELQGGEQKTHTVGLAFGDDTVAIPPLSWILEPSIVSAKPEWYAVSEAIPYLTPAADSPDARYEALVRSAIEGDDSFDAKRERIDEYGWRNFGELYADHEAVDYHGDHLLVSHYNNQYDAVGGFAIQFMRSGAARWWTLMDELASHVIDIDLYRTGADKAAYNGGLFWHTAHYKDAGKSSHRTYPRGPGAPSGGPSNEHNYSNGLLLHYLLTGRRASREAVIQLADWVVAMDDGRRTVFRWLTSSPTGLASSTASPAYHGPGRGAGNSIAALLNAHRLTGERGYLRKAEDLIRRCIHPVDDLEARTLLDAERRWSYTVFLQVVSRYLDEKATRGELDAPYSYARESLLHYARWMAAHEYPYLEKPEILEYPTETWAAQDIRKAEVLAHAARHAPVSDRARLLERAEFFFATATKTLLASTTRTFTRPVVILLSNGFGHAKLVSSAEAQPAPTPIAIDFGVPISFTAQKSIAKRRVLIAASAAVVLAVAVLVVLLTFVS